MKKLYEIKKGRMTLRVSRDAKHIFIMVIESTSDGGYINYNVELSYNEADSLAMIIDEACRVNHESKRIICHEADA